MVVVPPLQSSCSYGCCSLHPLSESVPPLLQMLLEQLSHELAWPMAPQLMESFPLQIPPLHSPTVLPPFVQPPIVQPPPNWYYLKHLPLKLPWLVNLPNLHQSPLHQSPLQQSPIDQSPIDQS